MSDGVTLADRRSGLRLIGGVLFAAGALIVYIRETNNWDDVPLLLTLLIPCALLYGMGVAGGTAVGPLPWQVTYLIFGVLLVPPVLFKFVDTVQGTPGDSLNVAWIFALTAGLAAVASFRLGARYAALLSGLSLLIAWLAVWDKILDNPSAKTNRWLLLAFAALLIVAAIALRQAWAAQSVELTTVVGVAMVLVGVLTVAIVAGRLIPRVGGRLGGNAAPSVFWDLVLLLFSIALIAVAARVGGRGPGYTGALCLLIFIAIIGADVNAIVEGNSPSSDIGGWAIALLVVGGGAVIASLAMPPDDGPGRGGAGPGP
jgi:hypothetical protein